MNTKLLILDLVGALLIGLGLFELFTGSEFIPEAYRFANYEIALIILGVLLTIPYAISVIKRK